MEAVPYIFSISGFTKRQPIVESKISAFREKAVVALGITSGARLMLSTPPATAKEISPATMALVEPESAAFPDAQRRFTVVAGTLWGMLASRAAMRATLRL